MGDILFFYWGTIAVVVAIVRLHPEDGDDLDEEEDAGIDGRDDAQHLKSGKKLKEPKVYF